MYAPEEVASLVVYLCGEPASATWARRSALTGRGENDHLRQRHALLREFFDGALLLCQMRQSHAAQDVRRLGELDIVVADNLYAIAPRVEKVEKRAGQWLDTGFG